MSKSFKSRLTGSGEKPRASTRTAKQSGQDWMACLDRIHQCCRVVEMLGRLLEGQGDEPVSAEAVREAGGTLVGQVKQLRAALADLGAVR